MNKLQRTLFKNISPKVVAVGNHFSGDRKKIIMCNIKLISPELKYFWTNFLYQKIVDVQKQND